jgi:hypothetical protein
MQFRAPKLSAKAYDAGQSAPRDARLDLTWMRFFRDLYLGFGPEHELLLRCAKRAYRDFNRTWRIAPGQAHQRSSVRALCCEALVEGLSALSDEHAVQEQYDKWHGGLMDKLMRVSDPAADGSGLTLGEAQKWINMSVKYAVGGRLLRFDPFERFAHVPIDRILLKELSDRPEFASAV